MKKIHWEENGSSLEIMRAINSKEEFTILTSGPIAEALISVFGAPRMGITAETGALLIGLTIVLAIAGLTLFALAKGYKVTGKAKTPDGQEYEINFEPGK